MEYTQLGRSGLKVSRLVLGTMNFGVHTEEAEAHRILDTALDLGVNVVDTADLYGWPEQPGRTETIIGNWLAQGGGRRERVVLATKVYSETGDGPNEGGLSALHIRRAVEASLRRLRTDHIDLYQMHHVDRSVRWEEIWQAMEVLVTQGKITYVGSSNFAGWHLAAAQESAGARGLLGPVSEQSVYNLLERTVELEVAPAARHYGVGLLPWSPLHSGLLGGVLRQERSGIRRTAARAAAALATRREQIQEYEDFAAELGHEPGHVALAWLLAQPAVTAPVVGPRTLDHLHSAVAALDVRLEPKALDRLDQIFPGHRPAPEAYAW
jgi:aryl-alcohol dehydrogenase-like predicted oxidoreductase